MRKLRKFLCYVLPLVTCMGGAASSAAFAESAWSFSSGLDYSAGKYGTTERSESWSLPFSVKYDADNWVLRLSIPYLTVRAPSGVVGVGPDRVNLQNTSRSKLTESGWGDVVFGGSVNVWQNSSLTVDLGGKIKFGTADELKGLGTGKNDYTAQVDVYQRLGGGHSVFGTLGARKMGDPTGVDLRDPLLASVGWSFRQNASTSYGVMYDFRQRLQKQSADLRELAGFMSYRIAPPWKMQAYVVKGFSNASPDYGGGVVFSYSP